MFRARRYLFPALVIAAITPLVFLQSDARIDNMLVLPIIGQGCPKGFLGQPITLPDLIAVSVEGKPGVDDDPDRCAVVGNDRFRMAALGWVLPDPAVGQRPLLPQPFFIG